MQFPTDKMHICSYLIWDAQREKYLMGFATRLAPNQPAQLQWLARIMSFTCGIFHRNQFNIRPLFPIFTSLFPSILEHDCKK